MSYLIKLLQRVGWYPLLLSLMASSVQAGLGIGPNSGRRWPGGVIPYTFAPGLDATTASTIRNAMTEWEQRTGGAVRFVPRQNQMDYVEIQYADPQTPCLNTSPQIGRNGGRQPLFTGRPLSKACLIPTYLALHELGHVIGLIHEHQRQESRQVIAVHLDRVQVPSGKDRRVAESQFTVIPEHMPTPSNWDPTYYGGYDLQLDARGNVVALSIMHYSSRTNSRDPLNPILTLQSGSEIPQANALSPGDVATVRSIYGFCDSAIGEWEAGTRLGELPRPARHVSRLYAAVLDRNPGAAEVDYWLGVAGGQTVLQLAKQLTCSAEARRKRVVSSYRGFLKRDPGSEERDYWAMGKTWADVAAGLASSDEYFARAQRDNAQYVAHLYLDLLGRVTDRLSQLWLEQLFGGASRPLVVGRLINERGGEFYSRLIQFWYRSLLGRDADAGGSYWIGKLQAQAMSWEEVYARILASDEFISH